MRRTRATAFAELGPAALKRLTNPIILPGSDQLRAHAGSLVARVLLAPATPRSRHTLMKVMTSCQWRSRRSPPHEHVAGRSYKPSATSAASTAGKASASGPLYVKPEARKCPPPP